jgi:hypothetical protein
MKPTILYSKLVNFKKYVKDIIIGSERNLYYVNKNENLGLNLNVFSILPEIIDYLNARFKLEYSYIFNKQHNQLEMYDSINFLGPKHNNYCVLCKVAIVTASVNRMIPRSKLDISNIDNYTESCIKYVDDLLEKIDEKLIISEKETADYNCEIDESKLKESDILFYISLDKK